MPSIQTQARPALKLAFTSEGDRWSHALFLVEDETEMEIARSVEGTPDEDWPLSSPLQEVTPQGEAIVLGVGMAGHSHWSASFSIESDRSLLFDFACLRKKPEDNGWIGSTYELADGLEATSSTGGSIEVTTKSGNTITLRLTDIEAAAARFELIDRRIAIMPVEISESPVASTRWAWRISLG